MVLIVHGFPSDLAALKVCQVVFCVGVGGVFKGFPPHGNNIPLYTLQVHVLHLAPLFEFTPQKRTKRTHTRRYTYSCMYMYMHMHLLYSGNFADANFAELPPYLQKKFSWY